MRAVYTRDYVYIFNPWATGEHEVIAEWLWYRSYAAMRNLARRDPAVAERFRFANERTVEELYNYSVDPNALNNLVDNPSYQSIAEGLRGELLEWMRETDDYVLPAFENRNDTQILRAFMAHEDRLALERAQVIEWKRWRNRAQETGNNTGYYDPSTVSRFEP